MFTLYFQVLSSFIFAIYITSLNIKIIKLEKNLGLGSALNIGLNYCSYDWIFRMDTDDICENKRFEKQIDFIKNNPKIDLFGMQIAEFAKNINEINAIKKVPIAEDEIIKFAKYRSPFNHMTVAFKKDKILEIGSYQHHLYMEDYNLWLRAIADKLHLANIDEIGVYARVNDGMISRRRGLKYAQSEFKMAQLKIRLKICSIFEAYAIFFARALTRLLPSFILKQIYKFLRR